MRGKVQWIEPRTIYAGVHYGLYRSSEGGEDRWTRLTPNNLRIVVYSLLILDTDRLIVGTDRGVYASINGGQTWKVFGTLPSGTTIDALVHDATSDRIYAGGNKGVFSRPAQ